MIDNKDSKKRYRVDHLIEGFAEDLNRRGRVKRRIELVADMEALLATNDYAGLKKLIEDNKIKCAVSDTCNWTDVRQFNLMFSTQIGFAVAEDANDNITASGNGPGYIRELSECAENRHG